MEKIIFAVFLTLHGLVHLLYLGQGMRYFELATGLTWPDGSWAFSRVLGDETTRLVASAACILAAVGFIAGTAGIALGETWWRPAVIIAAIFSSAAYLLLWNGKIQSLDDQGGVGILINLAILALVVVLEQPEFSF